MEPNSAGSPWRRSLLIIFAVLAVSALAYFLYDNYSPAAKEREAQNSRSEKASQAILDLEAALRADTYGGKTPEETLQMFVDALKKGDMELASKYFMLDTDMSSPDYLTRKKWEDGLKDAQSGAKIQRIINLLEKAEPTNRNTGTNNNIEYAVLNDKGLSEYSVEFVLNEYSKIWKIESM